MPATSSTGSVLPWLSSAALLEHAGAWARRQAAAHADLEAVGMFGSYGRGDARVGRDVWQLRWGVLPLGREPPLERFITDL